MADIKVSPFLGIDVHSPDPNDQAGMLRDAVNVDVDRDGGVGRRDGLATTSVVGSVRSVRGLARTGRLIYVEGGNLKMLAPSAPLAQDLGPVEDSEVEYADINGEIIVAGLRTLGVIRNGALEGLGVEVPSPPLIGASEAGGFQAGRYGVLITFIASNGEESGASEARFIDVAEGGGIEIQALPIPFEAKVKAIRIYRTPANGDVFYADQDLPLPHVGAFLLNPNDTSLTQACTVRFLKRMVPGKFVRYWRGRVLVARGPNLYMSEPMRYGLHDPRTGFIQFPQPITLIQPVLGGIFVGQRDGVVFLRGVMPSELQVVQTGAGTPTPGSSTEIDGEEMSGDFAQGAQKYAVWLGTRGYAIGMPNGDVVEPQSKRLAVPVGQRGVTVVHNRRLTTLVT